MVIVVVMFVGPFERFSAGDLDRIRAAESNFTAACLGTGDARSASRSLSVLLGYFRRDPDQPLPLRGATAAASMRTELSTLLAATATGPCSHLAQLRADLAKAVDSEH
jgi:hypothetical protein